jgi:hypothetical protein
MLSRVPENFLLLEQFNPNISEVREIAFLIEECGMRDQ